MGLTTEDSYLPLPTHRTLNIEDLALSQEGKPDSQWQSVRFTTYL